MTLDGFVSGVKASMSSDRGKTVDYLMNYKLKGYFPDDLSDEEKVRRKSALEEKVNQSFDKYGDDVSGIAKKGVTRGAMGLAVLNDVSAYVSKVPIANVTGLGYALFAVKTIAEMPAMYRYMKKSHDWYGAGVHYLMKPVNYLIPVVGGAIEAGSFDRMVRKRAMKEASDEFIKEFGNYVTFDERLSKAVKRPLHEVLEMPEEQAA